MRSATCSICAEWGLKLMSTEATNVPKYQPSVPKISFMSTAHDGML